MTFDDEDYKDRFSAEEMAQLAEAGVLPWSANVYRDHTSVKDIIFYIKRARCREKYESWFGGGFEVEITADVADRYNGFSRII